MAYFDYAATTFIDQDVQKAMHESDITYPGNPSSLHDVGIKARKWMNQHLNDIARLLGCDRKQIMMTGSGTEATNLAVKGVYFKNPTKRFITTKIEHHATLRAFEFIESLGADVVYLDVDHDGFVNYTQLEKALKEKPTALTSIIHTNNELGTVQDIKALSQLCKKYDSLLHLDMVQSVSSIPINFDALPIDFATLSSHKFYGPKGVGLLYAKDKTSIESLVHGGKQMFSKRAGTENIAGIVGFTESLKRMLSNQTAYNNKMREFAVYLINRLQETTLNFCLNGPSITGSRVYTILNIGFKACDGQDLVFRLNQAGHYVSLGSACDSENIDISHVLKAIDVPEDYKSGSIRISFGNDTTFKAIDAFVNALYKIINE